MQGLPAQQGKTCIELTALANMSSLFGFVKSRLDYLDLAAEMGRDEVVMETLRGQCMASMTQCVQKVSKVSLETATDITKVVKDNSTLKEADKFAFLSELESRLQMGADFVGADGLTSSSSSSHMGKLQTCLCLRLFLWESVWQIIFDVDQPLAFVMKACSVFFKKLGINNPSEKTVQNLVATVVCARQQVTKVEISCDDRLAALRCFKEYLRTLPLQYEGPTLYCETPEQLRTRHPGLYAHAYSAEPPADARVSDNDVQLELARTPMRGTSGKTTSPMGSWNSLPRSSFHHVLSALRVCQNPAPGRSRNDDIGLTIFDTPRPAQPRPALPDVCQQPLGAPGTRQDQLALTDAFQQRQVAPGTLQDQSILQPAAAAQNFLVSPQGQAPVTKPNTSVDTMLAHFAGRANAVAGSSQGKGAGERKAEDKGKSKAKPKGKAKAKAASKPHSQASAAKPKKKAKHVLGCSKCRYTGGGCATCRNASFTGKRGRP